VGKEASIARIGQSLMETAPATARNAENGKHCLNANWFVLIDAPASNHSSFGVDIEPST
jgi:hypothetical protein